MESARNAKGKRPAGGIAIRNRKNEERTRPGKGKAEGKEKKSAQRDKTHGQDAIRLREQRRSLAKDISQKKEKSRINKAPPTPAPKTKAHPIHLIDSPNKSVRISQDETVRFISGEEEGRRNIQPGPINLTKRAHVTWPHNLAKLAIAILQGELERSRHIGKQRRPRTFKIICDPSELGRTLQEMADEPTRATLYDVGAPNDS